jgi:5-oxoprolinase (ATP-hydrolysing)
MQKEVNQHLLSTDDQKPPLSVEDVAMGFIHVANEAMCRPIRALTQARGLDTSKHALSCFGGAGGQHVCSIARDLGISQVFVHKYAGILSAYGMALADVVSENQQPCGLKYTQENSLQIEKLSEECTAKLIKQVYE